MKSRFPWNIAILYCSRVFFELSRCCFQVSQSVYPLLRMWQRALDIPFTLSLVISQFISRHTPTLPNTLCPHLDDSTRSVRLMMRVVHLLKAPPGLIWPMIVTMQKWFTIFDVWIQVCHYLQFNRRGRVMHHCDYDVTQLRSDFSKPSVPFHLLLLWYIDKT